ncbi:hypothetical protein [Tamaricihabitans halophyticus]|uniref:hypothetical protein n=1 Tax=Tamaricihabitans halophyticus TaxID=1262583 RepID=UPI001FB1C21F|nr:hypothetical protein [Tamaricihabitans halophyticus]
MTVVREADWCACLDVSPLGTDGQPRRTGESDRRARLNDHAHRFLVDLDYWSDQ